MILGWNLDQQLKLTTKTEQQNKLTMASSQQFVTWFFRFISNLKQFGSRISDA